jgi:hypothetical protein
LHSIVVLIPTVSPRLMSMLEEGSISIAPGIPVLITLFE